VTKRALILVEGQTEERFVKDLLAPAFYALELYSHLQEDSARPTGRGPDRDRHDSGGVSPHECMVL